MADIAKVRELRDVQAASVGTDPYMRGLYNGLELALAVIEDREPAYYTASAVPSAEVWGVVHRETGRVDTVAEYEEDASYTLADGWEKRKGIAYFPPPIDGVKGPEHG